MERETTCPQCGQDLQGDEILCPKCGAAVTHGRRRFAGPRAFLLIFVVVVILSALAIVLLPR